MHFAVNSPGLQMPSIYLIVAGDITYRSADVPDAPGSKLRTIPLNQEAMKTLTELRSRSSENGVFKFFDW